MGNESARLRRTPLYEVAVAEGGRMVPFGGWEMPVQFAGISIEHMSVRKAAGLFDISHMGQFAITGEGGLAFLDYLLPAKIGQLAIGQMLYTPICNDDGGCVDDAVVYRLAEFEFLLVVNASRVNVDWDWVNEQAGGWANVHIENLSDEKGMLAIQGPQAEGIVSSLTGSKVAALGYYRCMRTDVAGTATILSRNGYTGEDGFELVCAADDVAALWRELSTAGASPCGLGARDTLRTEMGFCLYGHELNEQTTPLAAGLAWTLDLGKETDFIGVKALRAQREARNYRRLRGFRMLERGIPRADYLVVDKQGTAIGKVTSGTHSPLLEQGIGLAYLDRGSDKIGTQIYIDMRGKRRLAEVAKLPFVPSGIKKG